MREADIYIDAWGGVTAPINEAAYQWLCDSPYIEITEDYDLTGPQPLEKEEFLILIEEEYAIGGENFEAAAEKSGFTVEYLK